MALAIIANTFPDRQERARAIGVSGAVLGVNMALGPVLGGVLDDSIGWHSGFRHVPIGLVALTLTRRHVPESRAAHARPVDRPGRRWFRRAGRCDLRHHRGAVGGVG